MTHSRLVAVAAVLLLVIAAVLFWGDAEDPGIAFGQNGDAHAAAPAHGRLDGDEPAPPSGDAGTAQDRQRQTVELPEAPEAPAPDTGDLRVRVTFASDGAPAPGVTVVLRAPGDSPRIDATRARTNELGEVLFEQLPPGRRYVTTDRAGVGKRAEVEPGATAAVAIELRGLDVAGVVVDHVAVPVAGAVIEVAPLGRSDADAEAVALSGSDGRFAVRAAPKTCLIGARAAGYTSSKLHFLVAKDGNSMELRIELGKDGGMVEGFVTDTDGRPIEGAVALVGTGKTSGLIAGQAGAAPIPALVRTDAEGRFYAVGVPAGEQPVQVRKPGHAPWAATCQVAASATTPVRIVLGKGAALRGVVTANGEPAARTEIEINSWASFSHFRAVSGADGAFELTGLPSGELTLRADNDDLGKAELQVRIRVDVVTECEVRLSRGIELHGRVVDENGDPVADAMIMCDAQNVQEWWAQVRTDQEGRFSVGNCPEGAKIDLDVQGAGIEEQREVGVDPLAGEAVVRVKLAAARSVIIRGVVVGPDGRPVANAEVWARRQGARHSTGIVATGNDGAFQLPPARPGEWQVVVQSKLHPSWESDRRVLGAKADWDLGTITLAMGGSLVVTVNGTMPEKLYAQAAHIVHDKTRTLYRDEGVLRSPVLLPGDYRLFVSGETTAAQGLRFTIREGMETRFAIDVQDGVMQPVEIVVPADIPDSQYVFLWVFRGERAVERTFAIPKPPGRRVRVCLRPGDYVFEARAGARRGRASVTIGNAAGAPVRVEIQ